MTSDGFGGRRVLIVGCRGVIGESLCRFFVERNAIVVGCSRGSMHFEHEHFRHHLCDVRDEHEVVKMFQDLASAEARPEIVVVSAAVASTGMVAMVSSSDLDAILGTNIRGIFFVIREALKGMMQLRFGRLIVLSSIRVTKPARGCGVYSLSKAGVEQLVRVLPFEVGNLPITFNAIEISLVGDGMGKGLSAEAREELVESLPMKRLCTPDDICNAVEFFARSNSSYVTGQILRLGFV